MDFDISASFQDANLKCPTASAGPRSECQACGLRAHRVTRTWVRNPSSRRTNRCHPYLPALHLKTVASEIFEFIVTR